MLGSQDPPPRGPGRPSNGGRPIGLPPDREAGDAAEDNVLPRSGDTVIVMSKFPLPLRLRLFEMVEHQAPHPGGTRKEYRAKPVGKTWVINGNATTRGGDHEDRNFSMYDGYAMTPGIPADFWNEWVKQNAGSDLVMNQIVYARATLDAARGKAKEFREIVSGMEPLNPKTPAQVDRRIAAYTTADER